MTGQPVMLTIAEAAAVLEPPITEKQLQAIIIALGWKPAAWRRSGKPGRPTPLYQAADLMNLHAALIPFASPELPQNRARTGIMTTMHITRAAAAAVLDPPVTQLQVGTLIALAAIPVADYRRTGRRGRPALLYDHDAIVRAHAEEAARTSKQFTDNDWIASALLGRHLIDANPEAGTLYWPDGTRAERMTADTYGVVDIGREQVAAHRVIWIAAEGEIPHGVQINHRNRLRWDNRRANLELVTWMENIRHAHGKLYLTQPQAMADLENLEPEPAPESAPWTKLGRAGGVWRASR